MRTGEDPQKILQLGKRYELAMSMALFNHATTLPPHVVGISPLNRLFSVQQVHKTIIRSFVNDGHIDDKPHIGVCVCCCKTLYY